MVIIHCLPYFITSTPSCSFPYDIAFLNVLSFNPHNIVASLNAIKLSNGVLTVSPFMNNSSHDKSISSFHDTPYPPTSTMHS